MLSEVAEVERATNGVQSQNQSITSFNRPPRIRPERPTDTVRLPSLPERGRQGRAGSVISSLLTSGALIGATFFVNRSTGGSLLFLVPMIAGAGVFLLLSVTQLIQDYVQRFRDSRSYRAAMRVALVRLTQLYTDQQTVQHTINLPLTQREAESLSALLDHEQRDLLERFYPRGFWVRLLRRSVKPQALGILPFKLQQASNTQAVTSALSVAGYNEQQQKRALPHSRLWERRPSDPDFLTLRLGRSDEPSSITIKTPYGDDRPIEIEVLVERFSTVHNIPILLSLVEAGSLGLAGSRSTIISIAHALLWQVVVQHAYSDVRIAAIYDESYRQDWLWLRWLRHTVPLNDDQQRRMIAVSNQQTEQLLIYLLDEMSRRRERAESDVRPPHLIVLLDGHDALRQKSIVKEILRNGKTYGISLITLANTWEELPGDCGAVLRVDSVKNTSEATQEAWGCYAHAGGDWSKSFPLVLAPTALSERLSRALRPYRLAETGGNREIPRDVRLLDLLRRRSTSEFDPTALWAIPVVDAWHATVPIGRTEGNEPIFLDLREHHDGPHGIIAGKTGAGKSELLQSIITAVAATHSPDWAQFMLIDFKGGASLRIFESLPHTVGLVTDLQDGRAAERAIIAMKSEIRRRKDLLNRANVQDIKNYRNLPRQPETLANLLIVIDEFDAMVKEQPGFVNELITVVKQGRSLGVHLLVATQQPSVAVKDEIKGQLQYWIALRLGSANDSREMLQRPDAYYLPGEVPGRAYIRIGTQLKLFQAARVSAPFQARIDDDQTDDIVDLDSMTGETILQQTNGVTVVDSAGRPRKDIDFIIEQIKLAGVSYLTRSIWCPPLPARITLSQRLYGDLQIISPTVLSHGRDGQWWHQMPEQRLFAPVGLIDIPQESRQIVTGLDLTAGHVLIIGAPGSGKTTLLRTMLLAFAVTHSPRDLWCYVIDAGGQGLSVFRSMPHIGTSGIVQVRETDAVRRIIWMFKRFIEEREQAQREAEQHENVRKTLTSSPTPALVLIIDKFALFREEYEQTTLADDLITIATQGRAYDIHLVVTADRPGDVSYRLQGLFDTRLLLRLTDESDSLTLMGRRDAAQLPLDFPGRGYRFVQDQGWLEFQVALPYIDTSEELLTAESINNLLDVEMTRATRAWMEQLKAIWEKLPLSQHTSPPAVRLLPEVVSFHEAVAAKASIQHDQKPGSKELDVIIGLEAQVLGRAEFHLCESTPALFIVGGFQSGKTVALRTMIRSIALRHNPENIQLVLVDPRRTSFRQLPIGPHTPIYATTEAHLAELADRLDKAIDSEEVQTPWVVCIDDFDVGQSQFTTQFTKPFSGQKTFLVALEKLLNLGRERGFYVIVGANTSNPVQFLGLLNAGRHGLVLQPHNYPPATNLLGVRLPVPLSGNQGLPGRGLMVVNNLQQWVQIAEDSDQGLQT